MRPIGLTDPGSFAPSVPDTFGAQLISSAGAVVAQDWPSGAKLVNFSAGFDFWVDWGSTGATVPTSSVAGSTAFQMSQNPGLRVIPPTTGYSVVAASSGVISAEFWGR